MPSPRRASPPSVVARLAADAYDAVIGEMPWQAAFARMAVALGADIATFVLFDPRDGMGGYACAVDIPERLQRDYAAHRTLLAQLAEGHSLAEAATRLGRSVSTALNQLQSIFEKSGTHRQAELVAALLRSATRRE